MKKNDTHQSSFVNIGSSSLLIIFLVLCLTTFAILSLSSVKSDYTFSEKLAERKAQYYDASATASRILDSVDAQLAELAEANRSTAVYMEQVTAVFVNTEIDGISISCETIDGKTLISYQVPTEDDQVLDVQLNVTDYTKNAAYYEIKSWRILSGESQKAEQNQKDISTDD